MSKLTAIIAVDPANLETVKAWIDEDEQIILSSPNTTTGRERIPVDLVGIEEGS